MNQDRGPSKSRNLDGPINSLVEKWNSEETEKNTQIRPDFQSSGTWKTLEEPDSASHLNRVRVNDLT